jgi:hypothetical protein
MKQNQERLLKDDTIPHVEDPFDMAGAIELLKEYLEVDNADEIMNKLAYEIETNKWFSDLFREIYTASLTGDLTKSEADRFVTLFYYQLSFNTPGLTPQEALVVFLTTVVLIFAVMTTLEPELSEIHAAAIGFAGGIMNTMAGNQVGRYFRTRKGTKVQRDSESVREALRSLNDKRYRASQEAIFEREEKLSAPTNIPLTELIDDVTNMTTEQARSRLSNAALDALQDEA